MPNRVLFTTIVLGGRLTNRLWLPLLLVAGCTDAAGNADLAGGPRNPAGAGPAPVDIGATTNLAAAGSYVLLAKTGITNVTGSSITGGNLGLSPAAASFITGFAMTADPSKRFSTSASVVAPGKIYAADETSPTPSNLTTAVLGMQAAYTDAAGRSPPDHLEPLERQPRRLDARRPASTPGAAASPSRPTSPSPAAPTTSGSSRSPNDLDLSERQERHPERRRAGQEHLLAGRRPGDHSRQRALRGRHPVQDADHPADHGHAARPRAGADAGRDRQQRHHRAVRRAQWNQPSGTSGQNEGAARRLANPPRPPQGPQPRGIPGMSSRRPWMAPGPGSAIPSTRPGAGGSSERSQQGVSKEATSRSGRRTPQPADSDAARLAVRSAEREERACERHRERAGGAPDPFERRLGCRRRARIGSAHALARFIAISFRNYLSQGRTDMGRDDRQGQRQGEADSRASSPATKRANKKARLTRPRETSKASSTRSKAPLPSRLTL